MMNDRRTINMKAEYEITPIRHLSVECPSCKRWFVAYDINKNGKWIQDSCDAQFADYHCPLCGEVFGNGDDRINIKECQSKEEVYKDCLKQKVEWN